MERNELNRMIAEKRKQNAVRSGKKYKRNIDWALVWVVTLHVVIIAFWLAWVGVLIWGLIHLVNWITSK